MSAHALTPQAWATLRLSGPRSLPQVGVHAADPLRNESRASRFSGWCRRRRKTPLPILTAFADTRPW